MICKNISHEMFLMGDDEEVKKTMEKYKDEYYFNEIRYLPIDEKTVKEKKDKKKFKNIESVELSDFFDNIVIDRKKNIKKERVCYFAVRKNGKIGLLPEILTELLDNRENVKKQMGKETDPFKKSMLNSLQLAYKVTCNSVYGQLGCNEKIGPIALMDLAACTTAVGRSMLGLAKHFAVDLYPKFLYYALNDKNKFYDYCNEQLINYNKLNDDEKNKIYETFRIKLRELF